jgi:curved DNA-binding protein
MALAYKDYYETLGVTRTASQDEIRSAYRRLARKYHPDVSKAKDAEERFKELNEAYEVLGNAEKRRRYDQLGANWRDGEEFSVPPGWRVHTGHGGEGIFSDFFESLFGRGFSGLSDFGLGEDDEGVFCPGRRDAEGDDQEVRVRIPLADTFTGAERTIGLELRERAPDGRVRMRTRDILVRIPKGVTNGQKIRLAGQGGAGRGRGASGDLFLVVELDPDCRFRVEGRDIHADLPVAPWEAALGATVPLLTPTGHVSLTIPPGASSGQKLRLRGKGIPNPKGAPGDLYAELRILLPKSLTAAERAAWERLAKESHFNPRDER